MAELPYIIVLTPMKTARFPYITVWTPMKLPIPLYNYLDDPEKGNFHFIILWTPLKMAKTALKTE
jgi:hypothetical protein